SQRAAAAILNGSPPTLTIGVTKLSENPATVIAYARQKGGRIGSSAMISRHAAVLQAYTTPYRTRIGRKIHPVCAASARSRRTPIRATRYAKIAEPQTNSSACSLRLTRG